MYKLYHQTLCPFSRKIRVLLAAKLLKFELVKENFWERRKEFIAMNTMGTVPMLFDALSGDVVCPSAAIVEYIEEKHNDSRSFIGDSLTIRAEVRRLQYWFDKKFYEEVSKYILNERFFKRYLSNQNTPDSNNIMIAKHNLAMHLKYIEFLLASGRKYLVGNEISLADFAAAGHISALDYFGDINWRYYNFAKEWYCLIKSHRSFAEILKDRIPNFNPPDHYSKLDF